MAETPKPGDEDEGFSEVISHAPAEGVTGAAGRNEEGAESGFGKPPSYEPAPPVRSAAHNRGIQSFDEEASAPDAPMEDSDLREDDAGVFADNVVSGLEHLDIAESEAGDLAEDGTAQAETASAGHFFAGWDGLESPETEASFSAVSQGRASAADGRPSELSTLSEIAAAASTLSDYEPDLGGEFGKHEELADAVQAALLSVYGQPALAGGSQPPHEMAFPEEGLPSMPSWHTGIRPGIEPAPADGLTPQDVILNYFDYTPASPAQSGYAKLSDYPDGGTEESGPDAPAGWPRNGPSPRPAAGEAERRRTARASEAPAPAYNLPATFPVPMAPAAASRDLAASDRESSRLLGAAAVGLVGGIAIAASLAAFLIYGNPRQKAVLDIPGLGNLRLDKEEQGYGRVGIDLGVSETGKTPAVKPAPDISSEVLASDAVAVPGQPVPLAISIRSQQPFERTLVSITGVPDGARLSAGVDAGGGNWLLPPRRLNGLTLTIPNGLPETLSLAVQLLDSNARTPLSAKSQLMVHTKVVATPSATVAQNPNGQVTSASQAVRPDSTPAPPLFALSAQTSAQAAPAATRPSPPQIETTFDTQTVPAPAPRAPAFAPFQAALVPATPASQGLAARRGSPRPEVEDLIREGNKRMREGDILEARQYYQKALAFGDAEAALAMGRSYDPIYFARIDKKNAEPDAAKAFDWYRRAMDSGAAQTAMVRIENLKHFLNE